MEIRTFHTVYQVLHCGQNRQGSLVYLCRKEGGETLYQLFPFEKRFLRDTTISFLNEEWKKESFQDFADLFLYEDQLYVAMAYYGEPSLEERMGKEPLEYEERLALGQNILEYRMVNGLSPYFACQCLNLQNILVTDALEIKVRFQLDDVEAAPGMKEEQVWNGFADLLEILFAKERKNRVVPPLEGYLAFLREDTKKDQHKVYREYLRMQEQMKRITNEERQRPDRFLFTLWDRLKRGIPTLKKILAILILLAVAGYLVFTVKESSRPKGKRQELIHYIGTLKIEE